MVAITRRVLTPTTVLDLTKLIRAGGERGLLGLAFSPDGTQAVRALLRRRVGRDGRRGVRVHRRRGATRPPAGSCSPSRSRRRTTTAVSSCSVPTGTSTWGSATAATPDDEGPGHAPGGNGQSLATLLGKMLRIDPTPTGSAAYTIPADNPYADGGGRPEIYVYGVRNPWRFSFDRKTGDLWIADVGQDQFEEVTRLAAGDVSGANLGWNRYEGTTRHDATPTWPGR